MTLFNPVFNCLTPIVIKRLKTQTDEELTPADEAGSVVLRQPPASKLANLFRIDVRDHALGLVTQQLGGRVTEHPPGGWLGPRTPSLREGPGSASVPSGSPDPVAGTGAHGAALRSWQAGAVQFTTKICGLVGRATMADPLSGGGAFSSLSARCKLYGRSPAVRCRDGLHPAENVAAASCRSRSGEGEVMPAPSARAPNQRSSGLRRGQGSTWGTRRSVAGGSQRGRVYTQPHPAGWAWGGRREAREQWPEW